tara:strand:+ start:102 stop:647 length:546 start_codon:yes stop_codon:yes gene_type:complete
MRGASKTSSKEEDSSSSSGAAARASSTAGSASKEEASSKRPEVEPVTLPEAVRLVEGLEFPCVVLSRDARRHVCTVRFEDGFVEKDVPLDASEIRLTGRDVTESATPEGVVVAAISATEADDAESENAGRAQAQPVYIINESETNVATGGGLRGIRHLRRSSKTPKGSSPLRIAAARAHSR